MFRALLLLLTVLVVQVSRAFGPSPCQATLQLTRQGEWLIITGHCRSLMAQPARYRYQLQLLRESRGGRSQNAQSGEFLLAGQQEAEVGRVQVNAGPQDHYRAQLLIFDLSGIPVAQDSISQATTR